MLDCVFYKLQFTEGLYMRDKTIKQIICIRLLTKMHFFSPYRKTGEWYQSRHLILSKKKPISQFQILSNYTFKVNFSIA